MARNVIPQVVARVGDDRVCGTREQRMLQVDLVRHRDGAGSS